MHNRNHYDEGTGGAMGWSAVLAGALIGAGVALLLAPQPGTELRGRLRDYANRATDDLLEKGHEALDTAMERGKEYYDKGEEVVREAGGLDYARQRGQEYLSQAEAALGDLPESPARAALTDAMFYVIERRS